MSIESLTQDLINLRDQSMVLAESIDWLLNQVDKRTAKFTEEAIQSMTEEAKDKEWEVLREMAGRLNGQIRDLKKLDKEYNRIRTEVNAIYGYNVIPSLPDLGLNEVDLGDLFE